MMITCVVLRILSWGKIWGKSALITKFFIFNLIWVSINSLSSWFCQGIKFESAMFAQAFGRHGKRFLYLDLVKDSFIFKNIGFFLFCRLLDMFEFNSFRLKSTPHQLIRFFLPLFPLYLLILNRFKLMQQSYELKPFFLFIVLHNLTLLLFHLRFFHSLPILPCLFPWISICLRIVGILLPLKFFRWEFLRRHAVYIENLICLVD